MLFLLLKKFSTWCPESVLQSTVYVLHCCQSSLRSSTRSSATVSWETALTSMWCPSLFESCWWSLGSSETRGLLPLKALPFVSVPSSFLVLVGCLMLDNSGQGMCKTSVSPHGTFIFRSSENCPNHAPPGQRRWWGSSSVEVQWNQEAQVAFCISTTLSVWDLTALV